MFAPTLGLELPPRVRGRLPSLARPHPTYLHDTQRALIRRRERRALADTLAVDPRVAERPSQARGPRLTMLQRALQSSSHSFELFASTYRCSSCGLTADKRAARSACATLCQPARPPACRQRAD
eukprot:1409245-Pyramimonas_sp.AAC.1